MMTADEIRREWVKAVLEGRLSTAAYLEPDLPEADRTGYVSVPENRRDNFAECGTLGE